MTRLATPISTSARAVSVRAKAIIAGAVMALMMPAPAFAQMAEDEPDVEDIARTPLQDLNIDRDDLPEVLLLAAQDPYDSEGLTTCNDIVAQVALLDSALGADFDIAENEDRDITVGGAAKSIVGSFIPFRGIIREVSGANDRKREVNLAITAGMVRRGFLKGLGQQRGCSYPASPREERGTLTVSD